MRNAPWNTNNSIVLQQKWLLANERATDCERLRHAFQLLEIKIKSPKKMEGPEQLEIIESTKVAAELASKGLFPTGLLADDFDWFTNQHGNEQREALVESIDAISQVPEIPNSVLKYKTPEFHAILLLITKKRWQKLLPLLYKYSECLVTLTRRFEKSIEQTLNAKEASQNTKGSWYQEADEGVRVHDKLVHLGGIEAKVLLYLCQRSNRLSEYPDFAGLRDTWEDGLDSAADHKIKIAKSNIRTCLRKIRRALQDSFKLSKDQDPLKLKRGRGWKLDKDLLQNNS